jgi:hypothetical protein
MCIELVVEVLYAEIFAGYNGQVHVKALCGRYRAFDKSVREKIGQICCKNTNVVSAFFHKNTSYRSEFVV